MRHHAPIIVPSDYADEVGMLTKAELMDIMWLYAALSLPAGKDGYAIFEDFRARRDSVLSRRKAAYKTK